MALSAFTEGTECHILRRCVRPPGRPALGRQAARGPRSAGPNSPTHICHRRQAVSLRIVVCEKYVPDATGDRRFADDHTTDREGVDGLLSELDEYGVEQALRIAEASGDAEVTVLTVGPDDAKDALRKALSMGADKAVH